MTDRADDRDEGESYDENDRSDADRPAGRLQPLVDLLDGLLTIAESDRVADGRGRIAEVDASVSTVDDFLGDHRTDRPSESTASSGRSEPTATGEYHVGTQYDGDEFVVVADLLGASMDEVAAGLTQAGDELVVQHGGETVARVDLPWRTATVTRARFNNGVLEIRLRSTTA